MPEIVKYGPMPVKSRPRRWIEGLRSFWQGPFSAKDPELARLWGAGRQTTAGISVNEQNAFTFSAVFDAVNQIASDLGKLPLNVRKRRTTGGGSDPYTDSKLFRLLKSEPNPEMGSMVFRRTITAHALTWHGGYAEIERDGMGRPAAFWPLDPSRVKVDREPAGLKRLIYRVKNQQGNETILDPADVLHINGLGFDPHAGYSTIHYARQAIGLALAAETFGASFFGNGLTFGGILSVLGVSGEEEALKIKAALAGRHQGPQRANEMLVTWGDMKYTPNAATPEQSQMDLLRDKQVEEVARFFNMPVHKLKNLTRATNNNIEQQDLEYYKGCLLNWITLWEEECNRKLISPLERQQQFIKHNANAFLRGDTAARTALYTALLDRGVYCADDVLELEDMNPQPNGIGKLFLVQGAMVAKDQLIALTKARIDKINTPAPAPAPTDPNAPPADPNAGRMLEELIARADRAEQVATEARAEATAQGEARAAAEANVSMSATAVEQARASERAAVDLAARADLESVNARREAEDARVQIQIANEARATAETAVQVAETERAAAVQRADEATAHATASDEAAGRALQERLEMDARLTIETEAIRAAEARAAHAETMAGELATARAAAEVARDAFDQAATDARAAAAAADEARGAAEAMAGAASSDRAAAEAARLAAERLAEVARVEQARAETRAAAASSDVEACRAAEQAADAARHVAVVEAEQLRGSLAALTAERDAARQVAESAQADLVTAIAARDQAVADVGVRQAAEQVAAGARQAALAEAEQLRAIVVTLTTEREAAVACAESAGLSVMQAETRAISLQTARTEAEQALEAARRAEEDATGAIISAHRSLVVHVMRGAIEREVDRVQGNKHMRLTPDKLRDWMSKWYDGHAELMTQALVPAMTVHLAWIRSLESPAEAARRTVSEHVATSKAQLEAVLDGGEADFARNLARVLQRWETERVSALADALMQKELDYAARRHAA